VVVSTCDSAWFERMMLVILLVILLRTFPVVQGGRSPCIGSTRRGRHLQLVDTGSDRIVTVLEDNMVVALSDLGFTNPSFSVNALFIGTDVKSVKSVKYGLNANPNHNIPGLMSSRSGRCNRAFRTYFYL
jgi:hypothetical protein